MKKAQLTPFIILGIVVLGIVAFSLMFREKTTDLNFEEEIEEIPRANVETVNQFMVSCLDAAAKEALTLITQQGGFIFRDQGGLVDWNIPFEEHDGTRVAYQIYSTLSQRFKQTKIISSPPFYPCFTQEIGDVAGAQCHETYNHLQPTYFFGTTSDPIKSINPDMCKNRIATPGYTCTCTNPPNSLNCRFSLQAQLEHYITQQLEQCLDFTIFPDVNITTAAINTSVTFSVEDTVVTADIPTTISARSGPPTIQLLSFSSEQKVRLKNLYQLARELISEDIDDITFSTTKNGQQRANNYGNIKVTVDYRDGFSVVTLNDTQSNINGKNVLFRFARENRFPALDYLTATPLPAQPPYTYDLYVIAHEDIFLTPLAFDPDGTSIENPLTYTYEGWKATELRNSATYQNGENCRNADNTNDKKRCARYTTTTADIGEHEVTITAEDANGFADRQLVRILVDDAPQLVLFTGNPFDDVQNDRASIEDPYAFDATQSIDTLPQTTPLLFRWHLSRPDNTADLLLDWSETAVLALPPQPTITNPTSAFNSQVGTHTLTVEAKNQAFTPVENKGSIEHNVLVSQCLPHRSEHASHPFNEVPYDTYGTPGETTTDFQANHTCCADNYQTTAGNSCYNLIDYGCLTDFTNPSHHLNDPGNLAAEGISPTITTAGSSGTQSDVYKRTLIRTCSGNRGNICDGPVNYHIEFIHTCPADRPRCTHSIISETEACVP